MEKKPAIRIGISSFSELITEGCYYVGKIDERFNGEKNGCRSNEPAKSFFDGNALTVQRKISDFLQKSISVRDEKESFYHGVLTAFLKPAAKEHQVFRNRESGDGINGFMTMHRLTGRLLWLAKACALANALTIAQYDDGEIPSGLDNYAARHSWINGQISAVLISLNSESAVRTAAETVISMSFNRQQCFYVG